MIRMTTPRLAASLVFFVLAVGTLMQKVNGESVCYQKTEAATDKIPHKFCKFVVQNILRSYFSKTEKERCCACWNMEPDNRFDYDCLKPFGKQIYEAVNATLCDTPESFTFKCTKQENVCSKKAQSGINDIKDEQCKHSFDLFFEASFPNVKEDGCCGQFKSTPASHFTPSCGKSAKASYKMVNDKICNTSASPLFLSAFLSVACLLVQSVFKITNTL